MLRQAVTGQNDWRFLYLPSLSLAEGEEAEESVFLGPAGEIPPAVFLRPVAGKAYHEKLRFCNRGGKKIWRTKYAYSPWRPSGALLPQNREGGYLLCRCPPFGTPDQTLTGGYRLGVPILCSSLLPLQFLLVSYHAVRRIHLIANCPYNPLLLTAFQKSY